MAKKSRLSSPNPHEVGPPRLLLTEAEAAAALGFSARALQSWRLRGGGPRYRVIGRSIRYEPQMLRAWLEAQPERMHTSDPGEAAK